MSIGALWRRVSGVGTDAAPTGGAGADAGVGGRPTVTLLVIDADKGHKWADVFDGCTLDLPLPRPPTTPRRPAARARPAPAADATGTADATDSAAPADGTTEVRTAVAISDDDAEPGAPAADSAETGAMEGDTSGGSATAAGSPASEGSSTTAAGDAAGTEPTLVTCALRVVQAGWEGINLASYTSSGCVVDVLPVFEGEGRRSRGFCIRPDFLLVRNEVRGVTAAQDKRNLLYGMQYAGVQSINSLESIIMFLERPLIHAHLAGIQRRLGAEAFPLVDQTYYPDHRAMLISPSFPCVVKVGHAHAGFGKIVMRDHHQFADMASVMAVTGSYCTAEPFIEADYDVRIQKLGPSYRAFQRRSMSGNWKTNTGTSIVEEITVTEQYRLWADEAATAFGGLDIVTVDAIHSIDDDIEYILEMNGTSSGLMPDREEEDHAVIRDLVLERMARTVSAPRSR